MDLLSGMIINSNAEQITRLRGVAPNRGRKVFAMVHHRNNFPEPEVVGKYCVHANTVASQLNSVNHPITRFTLRSLNAVYTLQI